METIYHIIMNQEMRRKQHKVILAQGLNQVPPAHRARAVVDGTNSLTIGFAELQGRRLEQTACVSSSAPQA